jgi:hypothetical protein
MAKLRKAKCVTLCLSGKGNKIFRNTDEKPFSEDEVNNFNALLAEGAIKLVEEPKEDVKEVKKK